jgi:hypothetical protein
VSFYFVFEILSAKVLSNSMVPDTGISNAQRGGLKGKKVRLTYALLHKAFKLAELAVCFRTAYPPPLETNKLFREILRDAAQLEKDNELV